MSTRKQQQRVTDISCSSINIFTTCSDDGIVRVRQFQAPIGKLQSFSVSRQQTKSNHLQLQKECVEQYQRQDSENSPKQYQLIKLTDKPTTAICQTLKLLTSAILFNILSSSQLQLHSTQIHDIPFTQSQRVLIYSAEKNAGKGGVGKRRRDNWIQIKMSTSIIAMNSGKN